MIKNKRELRSFIKKEVEKQTRQKITLEYRESKSLFGKIFGYDISCPAAPQALYWGEIMFNMAYAKKDYFKEGFILHEEDVLEALESVIEEINELMEDE